MHRLRSFIPSANYLFVFEAAARRLSFTAAAKELNVSQPAVSKTIRLLEGSTGLKLFRRSNGRLELTAEGKQLYTETQASFDHLHQVVTALRRSHSRDIVRVSFSAVFVQCWLLPRLDDFKMHYPDVLLRIEESKRDDEDLEKEDIDISARLGTGHWPGLRSWHFADEEVLPVCSPAYLLKHGRIRAAEDIAGHRLLHFEERHRLRMTWPEWLESCGLKSLGLAEGMVFTDNLSAIEAAVLGQGIALGWKHLVRDHVRAGRLVAGSAMKYRSGRSIHLIMSDSRPPKPGAELFRQWLLQQESDAELGV
jgi:LysR family transcriptional regulator, glycine cleavage system transcriptional activator